MKKNVVVAIVCFALAGVVWFGAPYYRAHKEKDSSAEAVTAFEKGDYRLALANAQQALSLNSNNVAACQVMADLADISRSPNAMVWRRRIAEIEPTVSNRLVFALCALRYEQPPCPIASQALSALRSVADKDATFHEIAAQLALKQGKIAECEKEFEEAIRLEPGNEQHRINLATVRLRSGDTTVSAAAHAELDRVAQPVAWRALMLHHVGRQEYAEAEKYSSQLANRPGSSYSDKLEHLAVLRGSKSAQFTNFLSTLQHDASTNVASAAELVTHLVQLGAAEDAVTWVKTLPASMQKEMPLPPALASAYFSLGRWRELQDSIQAQSWPDRDFARQGLLAYAARKQGDAKSADTQWAAAVQSASSRPELLASLGQMASTWGWTNETEAVIWRALRDYPKERWPVDSLQESYMRMRNTARLYELNTVVLGRQSTNDFARNNWAALSLLLHTNEAKAHEIAPLVYARDPKNPGFASTYAYSLYLQNRSAEALKVMEGLDPKYLNDPGVACYYGAVLAAAGQKEKARTYLDRAEKGMLLAEESNLVAEARKKL